MYIQFVLSCFSVLIAANITFQSELNVNKEVQITLKAFQKVRMPFGRMFSTNACGECLRLLINNISSNYKVGIKPPVFQLHSRNKIFDFPHFFQSNAFLRMLQRTTFIHAVVFEKEHVTVVGSGVEEELFFSHG